MTHCTDRRPMRAPMNTTDSRTASRSFCGDPALGWPTAYGAAFVPLISASCGVIILMITPAHGGVYVLRASRPIVPCSTEILGTAMLSSARMRRVRFYRR